jgi:protein TonB
VNATITIDTRMNPDGPEPRPPRPPLRPLIGMPIDKKRSWGSTLASVAIHGLILLLILMPAVLPEVIDYRERGAGGPGPAGGGGGGRRGSGVVQERLNYIRPPTPPPIQAPVLPPIKPPEVKKEEPKPEPTPAPPAPTPPTEVASAATGSGGSGADGTKGTGPGSGGGTGSGVGTGTGSATGPGTGGGIGEKYAPSAMTLPILPLPVPSRVRPYTMVAYFDVDEKGNSRLIGFNPSSDNGYNKRIREMLAEIRFRPAVLKDGTPVRDTAVVRYFAP